MTEQDVSQEETGETEEFHWPIPFPGFPGPAASGLYESRTPLPARLPVATPEPLPVPTTEGA